MTAQVFVDTNVLLYALDPADRSKQQAARMWRDELWRRRLGRISFQVLQEFYVKATRKWPDARAEARAEVRDLLFWGPVATDAAILDHGWKLQDRFQLSFWDALIVAAAKRLQCTLLLTEDLQTNQELEGIKIISPFQTNPSILAGE